MKSCDGGRKWLLHTTSPLVPGEVQVYAASRTAVQQLRLLACTAAEDHDLHKGPSALGRKGPTVSSQQAPLFGGEHVGALAGDGAASLFMDEEVLKGPHPPIGWRSVCPDQQNQLCPNWPNQLCKTAAIAEAAGPAPGGPCQWPMVRDSQCYKPPPPRQPHKPPWPGKWCHNQWSLKARPNPSAGVLWILHNPYRVTTHHQLSLGSQLKRLATPAHMRSWDWC